MHSVLDRIRDLETRAHWPKLPYPLPALPSDYGPPIPGGVNASLLDYTRKSEWSGDAMIEAAVAQRMFLLKKAPLAPHLRSSLTTGAVVARIGLVYGLDDMWPAPELPSAARVNDLFEALVAQVWKQVGGDATLQWLGELFEPWIIERYNLSEPVAVTEPGGEDSDDQTTAALLARAPEWGDYRRPALTWLASSLPGFDDIKILGTRLLQMLPENYPSAPPGADVGLANAIHDGHCDPDFTAVGRTVFKLAIIALAQRHSNLSPAELDIVRISCTSPVFIARLGLTFEVHRYLRHIVKRESKKAWFIHEQHSVKAMYALVGVTFLQHGWDATFQWLDELLSPWVTAACDGTFVPAPAKIRHRLQTLRAAQAATAQRARRSQSASASSHRHNKMRSRT
ncbi:RNase III domain-containing protein [Mycena kentingensis (nom. inval.)]|nr:RNase III domain-containing protein [Mycena kentingensis (nom. inval.)]